MTDASLAGWLAGQVTFGNLSAIASILMAFGYQMRRLQQIEIDIAAVKHSQDGAIRELRNAHDKAMVEAAATYTRRDVLAETLQSMNARLGNIETDLRTVKALTREAGRG